MKVFKGSNMLLPSNLMVDYSLLIDTCYGMVEKGKCLDSKKKPLLRYESVVDLKNIINDAVKSERVET
jgi:hypothetical protein